MKPQRLTRRDQTHKLRVTQMPYIETFSRFCNPVQYANDLPKNNFGRHEKNLGRLALSEETDAKSKPDFSIRRGPAIRKQEVLLGSASLFLNINDIFKQRGAELPVKYRDAQSAIYAWIREGDIDMAEATLLSIETEFGFLLEDIAVKNAILPDVEAWNDDASSEFGDVDRYFEDFDDDEEMPIFQDNFREESAFNDDARSEFGDDEVRGDIALEWLIGD
jgi:hypothetical protein